MNYERINEIKMLSIRALVSDRELLETLVLKGGNALELGYDVTTRASFDLDFSMEGDFTEVAINNLRQRIETLLVAEFAKKELIPFDITIIERPRTNIVKIWKGYLLEFKVMSKSNFDKTPEKLRSGRAMAIMPNNITKFSIDISSYEYVETKARVEKDGTIFYIYTPEMLILEKLRALCQCLPEYRDVIATAKEKGRARDFFDIHSLCQAFRFDPASEQNILLLSNIFDSKKVPTSFLPLLKGDHFIERQKADWPQVEQTLTEEPESFEFYKDFLFQKIVNPIIDKLGLI